MSTKIRKQIYLEKRQNQKLKRLAETGGVSEAEVIRRLIDAEINGGADRALPPDRAAWEAFVRFARQRAKLGTTGAPYKWNREEIYEERLSRYGRHLNDSNEGGAPAVEKSDPAAGDQ